MALASPLHLSVLLHWMASKLLSVSTAGAPSNDLSSFIRSGVIPSEQLLNAATVKGDYPHDDAAAQWEARPVDVVNMENRASAKKETKSTGHEPEDSGSPTAVQGTASFNSPTQKLSATHRSSRAYVYDRNAKPLSPLAGESTYPLYYTSYHLFAPSLAENTRPGLEYFGDPPDSYDSLYYGKYQRLAEDVFEQKFVQLRNAGDRRGDSYAEAHRQKRRRKDRAY